MAKRDSNYSEEDRLAFEQRDRRITKLSCLERACDLAISGKITQEYILPQAGEFVNWVYSDLKTIEIKTIPQVLAKDIERMKNSETATTQFPIEPKQDKQYPVPLEQERRVILEIVKQLHNKNPNTPIEISAVMDSIYDKYGRYPQNSQSISKILKEVFNV